MEIKGNCNISVRILIVHNLLIIYCKLSGSSESWEFKSQTAHKTRAHRAWELGYVYLQWGVRHITALTRADKLDKLHNCLSTNWTGSLHEKLSGKILLLSRRANSDGGHQASAPFWQSSSLPFLKHLQFFFYFQKHVAEPTWEPAPMKRRRGTSSLAAKVGGMLSDSREDITN